MPKPHSSPGVVDDWDRYWKGSRDGAAFSSGGISHPAVSAFWTVFFLAADPQQARIIDVAAGTGSVVAAAQQVGRNPEDFICIDTSSAAITTLCAQYPGVQGVVADALSIPLADNSLDFATSQFGVEYAGVKAVDEMVRLLVPGGRIALVMHCQASIIYEEAVSSLDAIARLKTSRFLPLAIKMFRLGFAVLSDKSKEKSEEFRAAATEFKPAFKSLEPIMDEHGTHVAGDTICELYNEVAHIRARMHKYEEKEVLEWLAKMTKELDAYEGRMASMCEAALQADDLDVLCDGLRNKQLEIQQAELLRVSNHPSPLAWVLTAYKK